MSSIYDYEEDDFDGDDALSNGGGNITEAAREKLRLTVERIENLEEEKKEVAEQIKDVYKEAKAMGYDTKILRMVVRERKKDADSRKEEEELLETYMIALGMI